MEPIIKTIRISPSAFALDLPQPRAGQKFQQNQTAKKDIGAPQVSIPPHSSKPLSSSVSQESLLNEAAIEKLVPRTMTQLLPQDKAEAQRDAQEKQKVVDIYTKAQQEGYLAGLEAGKEKSQQELTASLKQITDLFHSLKDIHELLFQEMENSAVEVVFEAITKIIGHAATDKKLAYDITREAIEQVKGRDKIIVRVSIKDYEMVKAALNQENTGELLAKNISVIADNLVQLGGCLIETEAGHLDARLEIQLQRLKDTLLGVRKSNADA